MPYLGLIARPRQSVTTGGPNELAARATHRSGRGGPRLAGESQAVASQRPYLEGSSRSGVAIPLHPAGEPPATAASRTRLQKGENSYRGAHIVAKLVQTDLQTSPRSPRHQGEELRPRCRGTGTLAYICHKLEASSQGDQDELAP